MKTILTNIILFLAALAVIVFAMALYLKWPQHDESQPHYWNALGEPASQDNTPSQPQPKQTVAKEGATALGDFRGSELRLRLLSWTLSGEDGESWNFSESTVLHKAGMIPITYKWNWSASGVVRLNDNDVTTIDFNKTSGRNIAAVFRNGVEITKCHWSKRQ